MQLCVTSEIAPLQSVLVHAPGREIDTMPPQLMDELLFDDILHGPRARKEHAAFRAIMERFGVQVLDSQRLFVEALAAAPGAVPALLDEVRELEGIDPPLIESLSARAPADLAAALIEGVPAPPSELAPDYLFRLAPIPNLLFARDAQVVIGDRLIISSMSRAARQREALLVRFLFRHHPEVGPANILTDFTRRRLPSWPHQRAPTLEGGDVLIFGEGVVVVGTSERTMEPAVDRLVEALRPLDGFHTLIMVPVPRTRSAMHLDTIFTRTSESECLVYPPMILPGSTETLSVIRIDLARPDDWGSRCPSLLEALRTVGVDLEPICCGGPDDYIQQAREQWTDGANSFAIAPGVVLLYARNTRTADELNARGYHTIAATELPFDEDGACTYDFTPGKKYAILVAGEELSRARGGPRCMTMPLRREQ